MPVWPAEDNLWVPFLLEGMDLWEKSACQPWQPAPVLQLSLFLASLFHSGL